VIDKIKSRMASEQGFTLIELLVVIVIIGILVAIAVPSYLSFRTKAQTAAAQSNVRTAVPAAEGYYNDSTVNLVPNTYTAITGAKLRTLVPGISATLKAGPNAAKDGYCLEDTVGTDTWSYAGGVGGASTVAHASCDVAYGVA
jgi:type IV pilus assembly protein PilA